MAEEEPRVDSVVIHSTDVDNDNDTMIDSVRIDFIDLEHNYDEWEKQKDE